MKPTKTPIIPATKKVKITWKVEFSNYCCLTESKISDMENNRRVIPPPIKHPIAAMVQGKNFLPARATIKPKVIAKGPRMKGLSMKNLEKVVTENTGHALL